MECFDSDGSDFELDFEGFESEREEDIEDPLDTAQEWDTFVDTEGEEEEEFQGFQVDWTTGNYQPRTTKAFKRTPGIKQPIAVDASPLEVFSLIFTDELWDLLVTETNLYAEQLRTQIPHDLKVDTGLQNGDENFPRAVSHVRDFKAASTPGLLEAN